MRRGDALTEDTLFVGLTRPPLKVGVTDIALIVNVVVTMEAFLMTRHPLTLLLALPIHGLSVLACARDARFFELALLWIRTRLLAYTANYRHWRSSSHSPLALDAPNARGLRRAHPTVRVA